MGSLALGRQFLSSRCIAGLENLRRVIFVLFQCPLLPVFRIIRASPSTWWNPKTFPSAPPQSFIKRHRAGKAREAAWCHNRMMMRSRERRPQTQWEVAKDGNRGRGCEMRITCCALGWGSSPVPGFPAGIIRSTEGEPRGEVCPAGTLPLPSLWGGHTSCATPRSQPRALQTLACPITGSKDWCPTSPARC